MKDMGDASRALERAGLKRVRDELLSLALPCVRACTKPLDGLPLPLGASRLGGQPDLPVGAAWPRTVKDQPMRFIAQLNLSEVSAAQRVDVLPPAGILWLFCDDIGGWKWGCDQADSGCTAVLYEPEERTELAPIEMPARSVGRWSRLLLGAKPPEPFTPLRMAFEPGISIPSYDDPFVEALNLDDAEAEALAELLPYGHQLGGHANPVQNDVRGDCCMPFPKTNPDDWRLLLQLDSDGDMMWGDAGMLYLMGRTGGRSAGEFDPEEVLRKGWLVMQCH